MTAPVTASCEIRPQGGLEVLAWPAFEGLGAEVMVTTRGGGVSAGPYESLNLSLSVHDEPGAVLENRRRTAAAAGAGLADFVFARQVHSSRAQVVTAADRGRGTLSLDDAVPDTDALVTADPGIVLAILVGDCVPDRPVRPGGPGAGLRARGLARHRGRDRAGRAGRHGRPRRPAGARAGRPRARHRARTATRWATRCGDFGPAAEAVGDGGAGRRCVHGPRPATGRWLLDLWAANRRQLARGGRARRPDPRRRGADRAGSRRPGTRAVLQRPDRASVR